MRTKSMRRLTLCALFVVSTYKYNLNYISRVMNENVHKMAKTKFKIYEASDILSCRAYHYE